MLCLSAILFLNLKAQSDNLGLGPAPPPKKRSKPFLLLSSPWVWVPVAQVLLGNGDNNVVRFSAPPGAREDKRSHEAVIKFTQYPLFKISCLRRAGEEFKSSAANLQVFVDCMLGGMYLPPSET